jgi:hypothetical protein
MNTTTNIAALKSAGMAADSVFDDLINRPARFNADAWHVMQERDESLIRDQLLHGVASREFIYSFSIAGTAVNGVSVVGARELASQYRGIKARIVAVTEKRGDLFIFKTFTPLSIDTRHLPDLGGEDDYYECVMEVQDIKTGNSIEVRKKEFRFERKRDGSTYERPHYDVIAESKAFRNGVLSVLPQSVIIEFEKRCLAAGNKSDERTLDQLRDGASSHATKLGLGIDRKALFSLSYSEISGLGQAAKAGPEEFRRAAIALGLIPADVEKGGAEHADHAALAPRRGRPPKQAAEAPAWSPTPEEEAEIIAREQAEAQRDRPQLSIE